MGEENKHWTVNKSDLFYRSLETGSRFYFDSIDDVMKKKSIEDINYLWVEEATEFTYREWLHLKLCIRAANPHGINRFFLSFNPEDEIRNAWLKNLVDGADADPKSQQLHLNHQDNPFLSQDERDKIEALADEDEEYDKIYRLGQWATPRFIIYTNWDIVSGFPDADTLDDIGYGLDFGYNNETALIKVGIRDKRKIYLEEVVYQSKLTNTDLINLMKSLDISKTATIMADSAEPQRIKEIASAGYNIRGVKKKSGEKDKSWVSVGIDRCKRLQLHITQHSTSMLKEIRSYKWKQNQREEPIDEPVKFRDHAMDAMRYFLGTVPVEAGIEFIDLGGEEEGEMAVATTREEILNQRYQPAEQPVLQEIPDEWDDEDD
jgi:phage terminase large subunit